MNYTYNRFSQWYVTLTRWEYWPFAVVYFPIFFYWMWLSVKARSLFFFFLSNPSIETGGMTGESKIAILDLIPEEYKPKGILIEADTSFDTVCMLLARKDVVFPIIAKPDIGERGTDVEKITNIHALKTYHTSHNVTYIIQEFVDYPIELGIFYYRFPDTPAGKITSVTQKLFMNVTGDGEHTIQELMCNNPRSAFQLKRFQKEHPELLKQVPEKYVNVLLEPIGNHCRGTTFINSNHIIDQKLTDIIDRISKSIPGFYFGRYDLKCRSIEELKQGKHIRIMELNGAGAEPAHIYHPGFSLFKAYKVLFHHWNILYKISMMNHAKGLAFPSFHEAKTQMFLSPEKVQNTPTETDVFVRHSASHAN
ncbi:MAG: hypothetical protein H7259_03320 [Cytophagales bacterium]|nr:hypothetical protein [Cytophaga sp.]